MRSSYDAKIKKLQEQLVQAENTCTAKLKQQTEKLHEAEATLKSTTDHHNVQLSDKVTQIESLSKQLADSQKNEQTLNQTINKTTDLLDKQKQEHSKAV